MEKEDLIKVLTEEVKSIIEGRTKPEEKNDVEEDVNTSLDDYEVSDDVVESIVNNL